MQSYRNPVHDGYFADPFVLRHDGRYVAVGTGSVVDGRVFEVLVSDDLVDWSSVGGALEPLPAEAGSDYWAPEIAERDGTFYLFYSIGRGDVGHRIRVASSDTVTGPYRDLGVELTPQESFAIDPHPLLAEDGRWYLYFARDVLDGERVGTMLAVAPLEDSMTAFAGEVVDVLRPTADWQIYERGRRMYGEDRDWHTLEGPFVCFRDGRYWCFYSGGSWQQSSYAVSWAVADDPMGPWLSPPDAAPLLRTVPGAVIGPGHNCLVRTPGGTDVMVYHAWDPAMTRRRLCIDPVVWTPEGPTVDGPSWQPRPRPL